MNVPDFHLGVAAFLNEPTSGMLSSSLFLLDVYNYTEMQVLILAYTRIKSREDSPRRKYFTILLNYIYYNI